MRSAAPIVNFRVLGERNLAISCIILFSAYAVLYGASVSVPAMLQALFNYDATADTFTPDGKGSGCGFECHTIVKAKDYIFHPYQKR